MIISIQVRTSSARADTEKHIIDFIIVWNEFNKNKGTWIDIGQRLTRILISQILSIKNFFPKIELFNWMKKDNVFALFNFFLRRI